MKLYEMPRNTWVMVMEDCNGPPVSKNFVVGDVYFFEHCDGMFSYCTDLFGNVVHIPAWAEVTEAAKPL
jgi:hypothetical protein